jgi:hypothetical protein
MPNTITVTPARNTDVLSLYQQLLPTPFLEQVQRQAQVRQNNRHLIPVW